MISMVVMYIFNAVNTLLSMKCNPGLILWILKYVVNYLKARIISLSLLFLNAVVIL